MPLFRNDSPGALTMEQAIEIELQREALRRRQRQSQTQDLAAHGRGGDTEVAHVSPGEVVVPMRLQTPEVMAALYRAAQEHDISLEQLRVGSKANSINPQTGAPEFFQSGPYDMCDHGMQSDRCEGWVPGFLKDKPSGYVPTPEDLARLPDAQKERYAEYYEGTGDAASVLSTGLGGVGRLYSGARSFILRGLGQEAGQQAASREEIAKAYRGAIRNPKPRF